MGTGFAVRKSETRIWELRMKPGQDLAEITAGIDRLYRAQKQGEGFLDAEGLIPVAVAAIEPRNFARYADAREALAKLSQTLDSGTGEQLRVDYLGEMIDSLNALMDTFEGRPIGFAERLRRQIRVDTTVIGDDILDTYRATIRNGLDELGYRGGDLAADITRWEKDTIVPRDTVILVLEDLLRQSRRRAATMYDFSHEWIEPVGVTDKPFAAYCDYPGRKVLLNLDFPYTVYALKHLATHEAFPGHLVHLGLRERYVADGSMPLDGAQVVTSSASSALFEGIADNGMAFLDWLDTPGDQIAVALQRLRSALRCNAAWMMHEEKKPIDEIAPIIATQGYQTEHTVRGRLAFLHHDLRAPFVYAYWCGDVAVEKVWNDVPASERKRFWHYLYGTMHTPTTLAKYWQ
ncbi:hypothetical protein KKY_3670 [Pelagibacterium halotolerans B2]|uniref:DUF885 domain-containing protein n=2 Tax=Pelagibacterium TaxID=1082930 RepID=G4RBL1_PELHB|nr:hypothetical protein KKY_3670 [Pelagibacterium halotolerans B2]